MAARKKKTKLKPPTAGPDMIANIADGVGRKLAKRRRGKLNVCPRSGDVHRISVDTDENYYEMLREYCDDHGLSITSLVHKALAREIGTRLATRRFNPIVNLKVKERE